MRTSQLYPVVPPPGWGVRRAGCGQGPPSGALVKARLRGPSAGHGGDLRAGGAAGGPGFLTAGSDRAGEGTGALAANGLTGCGGVGTSVADPGATGLGTGGHGRPGSSGVRLGEGSCQGGGRAGVCACRVGQVPRQDGWKVGCPNRALGPGLTRLQGAHGEGAGRSAERGSGLCTQ